MTFGPLVLMDRTIVHNFARLTTNGLKKLRAYQLTKSPTNCSLIFAEILRHRGYGAIILFRLAADFDGVGIYDSGALGLEVSQVPFRAAIKRGLLFLVVSFLIHSCTSAAVLSSTSTAISGWRG